MPLRTHLSRVARYAIVVAGIALLAFAARDSALRGLENWRTARVYNEIRMWTDWGSVPSLEQWQRTVDALREALRVTPRDPELWEFLGFAYEIASRNFAPAGTSVYSEFALIHFREAAALRPTSPYAWTAVAVMKHRLGQVDEEFLQAFFSAMRLGPWEPRLQRITSDLGLILWDRLDARLRDEVRENWRRTAAWQADALVKLAISRGRERVLCKEPLEVLKKRLKCANEAGSRRRVLEMVRPPRRHGQVECRRTLGVKRNVVGGFRQD